jgi:hypothetical protein
LVRAGKKTKKACKNCTCGRAEAEQSDAAGDKAALAAAPFSGCGSVRA